MRACKIFDEGECHRLIVCVSVTIEKELNGDKAC